MNSSSKVHQEEPNEEESANYLFHYTTEMNHLVSIMNDFFMPFYCMESLDYLNLTEFKTEGMAYPLVCFCDIPLSRHKLHKRKFGEYGIGMKKEWGMKNHLSAVVYTHSKSMTITSLSILINMARLIQEKLTEEESQVFNNSVSLLIMHYKSYEGRQFIKEESLFANEITCFYNEREWRYIPLDVDGLKISLKISEYRNTQILHEQNKLIQKNNRLKFNLNDVEFLFLKNEAEIDLFLSKLSLKYSEEDKREIKKKIRFK